MWLTLVFLEQGEVLLEELGDLRQGDGDRAPRSRESVPPRIGGLGRLQGRVEVLEILDEGTASQLVQDSTRLCVLLTAVWKPQGNPLADAATIVDAGDPLELNTVLHDLARRGIQRLMVEGGGHIHTQFLAAGLADEIHLVIAPFLVGQNDAPRFLYAADFPYHLNNPMHLAETRAIGNVVLLRYQTTNPAT